jgi:hypothetical protein
MMDMLKSVSVFTGGYISANFLATSGEFSPLAKIVASAIVATAVWIMWQASK